MAHAPPATTAIHPQAGELGMKNGPLLVLVVAAHLWLDLFITLLLRDDHFSRRHAALLTGVPIAQVLLHCAWAGFGCMTLVARAPLAFVGLLIATLTLQSPDLLGQFTVPFVLAQSVVVISLLIVARRSGYRAIKEFDPRSSTRADDRPAVRFTLMHLFLATTVIAGGLALLPFVNPPRSADWRQLTDFHTLTHLAAFSTMLWCALVGGRTSRMLLVLLAAAATYVWLASDAQLAGLYLPMVVSVGVVCTATLSLVRLSGYRLVRGASAASGSTEPSNAA
jgi:hypothetical protein